MIPENEIFPIGKFVKPHGVKGELLLSYSSDVFDREDFAYFVMEIDGIFVPFFLHEYRISSAHTAFVMLDGVADENAARLLAGKTVFAPKKYLETVRTDEIGIEYFVDFQVIDKTHGTLGKITDIDQSTANILLTVSNEKAELLVPFSESYIVDIRHNKKEMLVDLPEGLTAL